MQSEEQRLEKQPSAETLRDSLAQLERALATCTATLERLCEGVEALAQISMIQMDQSLSGDEEESGPDVPSPL